MKISRSKQFKKDFRKYTQLMSDKQFEYLIEALGFIGTLKDLPQKFKDHSLSGRLNGYRECHIGGDLILLYRVEQECAYLLRLGTHAEVLGI